MLTVCVFHSISKFFVVYSWLNGKGTKRGKDKISISKYSFHFLYSCSECVEWTREIEVKYTGHCFVPLTRPTTTVAGLMRERERERF